MEMFDLEAYLWSYVTSAWNLVLDALQELVIFLVDKLPDGTGPDAIFVMPKPDDFAANNEILTTSVNFICWIFPVQFYLGLMTAFGTFLLVYFCVAPLLRLLKIVK